MEVLENIESDPMVTNAGDSCMDDKTSKMN